jgi:methionyl-tRNA formyltransferase
LGTDVKLAFLAAADPIYLPNFFDIVLDDFAAQTDYVYSVPPLYKGQSRVHAAWRYYRTFGATAVVGLLNQLIAAQAARNSIKHVCARHGVSHAVVQDVNAPEFVSELAGRHLDVLVSVSCPQIFKRPLLETPSVGCLNIHGALLPEYRGIMPSFWMLANRERRAGVTVYFMNEEIDAGDIAEQRAFDIFPTETLDGFLRRSKAAAAEVLIDVLRSIEIGTLAPAPMDMTKGSYYSWPDVEAVRRFRATGHKLW